MEPRSRASGKQFLTHLEFMESHGDLAKPQPGAQGRIRADRLWQELTDALNSVRGGVHKTSDKWRKVWADWKTKTKKKALMIRRHASGTSGGPSSQQTLTVFEERLLAIMGAMAVVGQPEVEEQGFKRSSQSAAPSQHLSSSTAQKTISLDLEMASVKVQSSVEPPTLPPSTSRRQPATVQQLLTPPAPTTPAATRRRRPPEIASRRRMPIPFDRATSEFVALEQRRLQLEEMRERNAHYRESRRIEVDQEYNNILNRFADIAQSWVHYYMNMDNSP